MVASSGYAAASNAAALAVEVILADEFWQPETDRARDLTDPKDAADSIQEVARILRVAMMLEKTVAKCVRGTRLGVRTEDVGGAPVVHSHALVRRRPAGSDTVDRLADSTFCMPDVERTSEYEPPDRLPRGRFADVVDGLAADLGVAAD